MRRWTVIVVLALPGCGASSSPGADAGPPGDGGSQGDGAVDGGGRDGGGEAGPGEYDCWTFHDVDDGVPNPREPCPADRPFCCFSRSTIKEGWQSYCSQRMPPPRDDPDLFWCWENPPVGSTFDCSDTEFRSELCPDDRPYCCTSPTRVEIYYEFCAATPPQGWRCEGPE